MGSLPKKTASHSPFGLFDDGFNSLMEGFFLPMRGEGESQRLMPRVDLKEKDSAFEVKADLPGMKKDDIELTVHHGVLSISATREDGIGQKRTANCYVVSAHTDRTCGKYLWPLLRQCSSYRS